MRRMGLCLQSSRGWARLSTSTAEARSGARTRRQPDLRPCGIDRHTPPAGTVTLLVTEGRRVMRLSRELAPEVFDALLEEYSRLLRQVLAGMGGQDIEVETDTAVAAFPTARQGALAAVAAQRAVAAHAWPHGSSLAISVGLHSCEARAGWIEPALLRCSELCDAAEAGQIFLTHAASSLLQEEGLGDFAVRDLGEVPLRRIERRVRAYELVVPPAAD